MLTDQSVSIIMLTNLISVNDFEISKSGLAMMLAVEAADGQSHPITWAFWRRKHRQKAVPVC